MEKMREKETEFDNKVNTQEVSDLKQYLNRDGQNSSLPAEDNVESVDTAEAASSNALLLTEKPENADVKTNPASNAQIAAAGTEKAETPSRRRKKQAKKSSESKAKGGYLKDWIKDVAIALIIALIVMQFIRPTIVKQRSMQPNFHTDDYLFISKQSYKLLGGQPQMGDVIVFESKLEDEEGEKKMLIKRVIGVPGDVVSIHDGKVFINSKEIDDSYTMDKTTPGEIKDLIVPANHLFCLGDNRAVSVDSRSASVGLVPFDDVIGKVVFRVFPLGKFGAIYNPYKN